ncbi:MAG TPA: 8-amino-7-oxononanoate synthase [Myxococcales bacterium]|nr:8-amino-7-oxononanoate synthase [Myxococcales bacterium]
MADPLAFLDQGWAELSAAGLARVDVSIESAQGPTVVRGGHALLNLTSNDYLSLAAHPAVREAAAAAARRFGAGAGASRLLGGDLPIHRELEAELAALKGTEDAVVFPSGYHANTGIIPALVDEGDAVFSDALNHASIVDGCRLSRARREVYRHADAEHLEALLSRTPARRRLIVTDTLFSMDGDVAPLVQLCELAERHGAILMVDEAHATGIYGGGAGLCAEVGVAGRVPVQMGTLGKALGSAGAYVAGSRRLTRWLRTCCRSYVFTTALSPPACGAALAATRLVRAPEGRALREGLLDRARRFAVALRARDLRVLGGSHHLLGIVVGDPEPAMEASRRLESLGIFARAVRPPTVPEGTSRLRLSVCAGHEPAALLSAAELVADALRAALEGARRRVGT